MSDYNNPKLLDLVNNIDVQPVRKFLEFIQNGFMKSQEFFETDIDKLLNEITDITQREICQKILDIVTKDPLEDIYHYKIALDHFIQKRDIVSIARISIARICEKSNDDNIKNLAIEAINRDNQDFQKNNSHEIFWISKAAIHFFLNDFSSVDNALHNIDTNTMASIPSHWQEFYCNVLCKLYLNYNKNSAYIGKIKALDPNHRIFALIQTEKETEEESVSSSDDNTVLLTKAEVLSLSEQDFLQAVLDEKITLGLQKVYYKQLQQNQFQEEIKTSIKQCFFPKQENSESWVVNDKIIQSSQTQVHHIKNKTWATIDKKTLVSLDYIYRIAFENAITKGLAREKGTNGIKFMNNIAELKINSDLRLYTDTKYINKQGASIIIFNNSGNHKEIKRMVNNNHEMTECLVHSDIYDDNNENINLSGDITYDSEL